MKRPVLHRALAAVFAAMCFAMPGAAQACSACMGDPNSKTAGAINAAIFLMIGVIGSMLASLAGFGFYLWRRSTAPLHAELGTSTNDSDDLT